MSDVRAETEFRSFYKAGGTLPPTAPSYVVRKADSELLDALRQGEYCYVLDSRQVGKSSLIARAAHTLKAEGARVAQLDLTNYGGSETLQQWLYTLLEDLGSEIALEDELADFWDTHADQTPVARFMEAICRVALPADDTPLVIFIDEIDFVRSLTFNPDDLFAAIRAAYNRRAKDPELRRLTFCLVGSSTPARLIRNPDITPYNVGKGIELDDFTDEEATAFADGFGDRNSAQSLVARVLYWTGGHPYLTQFFCQAVSEANAKTPDDVDRLTEPLFFAPKPKEDKNLPNVVEKLKGAGESMDALLALYGRVRAGRRVRYDDKAPLHAALKLSGLLRDRDGWLRVRNRIYAKVFDRVWINANMSNAAILAEQEAYRKGLFRATAISLPILALIVVLASLVVHNANRANKADAAKTAANAEKQIEHNGKIADERLLAEQKINLDKIDEANVKLGKVNSQLNKTVGDLNTSNGKLNSANDQLSIASRRANHNEKLAEEATGKERIAHAEAERFRQDAERFRYDANMDRIAKAYESRNFAAIQSILDEEQNFKEHGFEWGYWNYVMGRKLFTLPKQNKAIRSVFFMPDGRRVVSYNTDGAVRAWDTQTLKEIPTFFKRAPTIHCAAFSADGDYIATGSTDGTITVQNLWRFANLRTIKEDNKPIELVALSPGGELVAVIKKEYFKNADGKSRYTYKLQVLSTRTDEKFTFDVSEISSLAFSPDGKRIAVGVVQGDSKIINIQTGEILGVATHTSSATVEDTLVNFSSDGKRVVIGTSDETSVLHYSEYFKGNKVDAYESYSLRRSGYHTTSVAFSPDGERIATGSEEGMIQIWDAQSGLEILTIVGHDSLFTNPSEGKISSLAFSSDGMRLVIGCGDGAITILNANTSKAISEGAENSVESLAFSPDSKHIVTGSTDSSHVSAPVRVRDVETGKELLALRAHNAAVWSVAYSPNGQFIAVSYRDGTVKIWNARNGDTLFTIPGGEVKGSSPIAFSPDSRRIATRGKQGGTQIWDVFTHKKLVALNNSFMGEIVFSPDGRRIITAGDPVVWNSETGKKVCRLIGHYQWSDSQCVTYSPDGKYIATGHTGYNPSGTVRIWNAQTGKELFTLSMDSLTLSSISVSAVAFSPDSKRLVTGIRDGIKVWDVQTGKEVLTIPEYIGDISSFAFSPDGRRIAVGGYGGTKIWTVDLDAGKCSKRDMAAHLKRQ